MGKRREFRERKKRKSTGEEVEGEREEEWISLIQINKKVECWKASISAESIRKH